MPLTIASSGKTIVPIRSACTIGLSETRPSIRAVGSPSRSAVQACALSCTVNENSNTMKPMKICAILTSAKGIQPQRPGRSPNTMVSADSAGSAASVIRLLPACEKRKDGVGDFRANRGQQLLACRTPHPGETPEAGQERAATARTDTRHVVELRLQIAHRTRLPMEGDREAVRLVSDPLDQEQRRIVFGQRDRLFAIAREEQLLFLRDADRDQVGEAKIFERGISGGQLTFAAVDQNQLGKRAALFEQLPIPAHHHLAHRREVVLDG